MTEYFNRTEEKDKRQLLRNEMPPAERLLWSRLRGQQIDGLRFRRQYGIGVYVLDFYCPSCKLAIELDGMSHDGEEAQAYDRERERFVESFGVRFVRFSNREVYADLNQVVEQIAHAAITPSQPPPSERGGVGAGHYFTKTAPERAGSVIDTVPFAT